MLAPNDPAPLRNVSAAYFELGQYSTCIEQSLTAVALSGEDNAAVQTLLNRMAKSYLYLGQLDNAASSLAKLDQSPEAIEMTAVLARLQNDHAASRGTQSAREKMINMLPRIKEVLWVLPCSYIYSVLADSL
jgi:lipopolysaccharide biosynthesis regulator YciM